MRKSGVIDIAASNPWRANRKNPFVLDADADRIIAYNKTVDERFQMRVDVPPEPVHGNPFSANVVVLMMNPGFHDEDVICAQDDDYCERLACEAAMIQVPGDYPFVPLDPKWKDSPCGSWWRKTLSRFINELGDRQVAERFSVLEWYPYHSRSFRYKSHILRLSAATAYNQEVAAACVNDPSKVVICMRGHDLWTMGCKFDAYSLPRPVNPRCASLTPGNLGQQLFDEVMKKLSK